MKYKITKIFKFESGHRFWKGFEWEELYNLHGHSFFLEVTVSSDHLNENETVIDTDILKRLVIPIKKEVDHAFFIDKEDPLYKEFFNKELHMHYKTVPLDGQPTYEKIGEYLFYRIKKELQKTGYSHVKLERIKLQGTSTIYAEIVDE